MCSLWEYFVNVNCKLECCYVELMLVYQQCGIFVGIVWLEKNEICLNLVLLLENQCEFIDEVVLYELVYLLVWQYFGCVVLYGKEWKWMMESVFGVFVCCIYCFEFVLVCQNIFFYCCCCQQYQFIVCCYNWVVCGEVIYCCVCCGDLLVVEK